MPVNPWSLAPFKTVRKHKIPPNPEGVISAFSRIGYSLEEAVADVIDNAIDAEADNVLVRFFMGGDSIRRIAVVNNGVGLRDDEINDAMEFGGNKKKKSSTSLGKFGIGLKTASFNQCNSVSLLSRNGKDSTGRRWTVDTISDGWDCDDLDRNDIEDLLNRNWGSRELDLSEGGTIIVWDDLDSLRLNRGQGDLVTSKYLPSLQKHLGLVFHRFLSDGRVKIKVDAVDADTGTTGMPNLIYPMDPFSYPRSGSREYPKVFEINMPGLPTLALEAHVWPSNSNDLGYKLGGGKVAERQGFYFYRNDRLIQAGGWNRWHESDSEPHTSLARVKVNLSADFDSTFRLNVQKSKLDVPPVFIEVLDSVQKDGKSFLGYFKDADAVYRKGKAEKTAKKTVVPGSGIPASVRKMVKRFEGSNSDAGLKVQVKWKKLPENKLFEIGLENTTIWVNSLHKSSVGNHDLFVTMIFLLLKDEMKRERMQQTHLNSLEAINQELLTAIGKE